MKKLLCVLLTLTLTLSLILCTTALAEDTYDEDDSTASTTLTTTIKGPDAPSYTLIIPSTLTITPNATSTTLTVQLTEANNANSIMVETARNGSMTNGSGGTIEFTVTSNELSFGNFSSLPSAKTMAIGITAEEWQQAAAGTYTGTMSFTISAE